MTFFKFIMSKLKRQSEQSSLTLAQASSAVTELEAPVSYPALMVEGGVLPDGSRSVFYGWQSKALTLRQYILSKVVLDRSLMVFLKNGHPVAETSYLQPPDAVAALTVRPGDLSKEFLKEPVMAASFDHWDINFFHWVRHTVPTFFALREAQYKGGFILPYLQPWQAETLKMNGFENAPQATTHHGHQYAFKQVIYTDYVRGLADFSVSPLSARAYRTLVAEAGGCKPDERDLFIFIERGSASNRAMPNEAELAEAMREAGFTVIRPETLSVAGQMRFFARARMVVGSLGAAMANVAWCHPGTVVYELVPAHHQNPCTLALTTQMGLLYWGDLIETGVEGDNHTAASLRGFDVPAVIGRAKQLQQYVV